MANERDKIEAITSLLRARVSIPDIKAVRLACRPPDGAMVALHTSESIVDPVTTCSKDKMIERTIGKLLGVRIVYFVKWHAESKEFIANALAPARPLQIFFQDEPDLGEVIAKVVVDEDRLDAAFGPEGLRTRLAAMLTEQSIEVILPHEVRQTQGE